MKIEQWIQTLKHSSRFTLLEIDEHMDGTVVVSGNVNTEERFMNDDDALDAAWNMDDERHLHVRYTAMYIGLKGDGVDASDTELEVIRNNIDEITQMAELLEDGEYTVDNPFHDAPGEEEEYE